jgi:hypothetical protein
MKLAGSMFALVCAGALTTACNSGRPLYGNIFPCPAIAAVQYRLIYPAPGSTAIPDSPNVIVVEPKGLGVELQPPTGPIVLASMPTAVPSPIPSPNASPFGPGLGAFSVPPLAAATTYTVSTAPAGVECNPAPQTLGSFTTQ